MIRDRLSINITKVYMAKYASSILLLNLLNGLMIFKKRVMVISAVKHWDKHPIVQEKIPKDKMMRFVTEQGSGFTIKTV